MYDTRVEVVVVGSVDHGKSTLIGRLLYDSKTLPKSRRAAIHGLSGGDGQGYDLAFILDQLQEEQDGRMTIDSSQTFLNAGPREYVIIDVPGHKELLKNMITGTSQASAAILVLDVNEGIQEQTYRHAHVLALLGIKQLIVVLNKMDQAGFELSVFENASRHLLKLAKRIGLEPLAFIPTSAVRGDNVATPSAQMPWYRGPTVVHALHLLKPRSADENLPLRLPIQGVYEIASRKLALGRVVSGRIAVGDKVSLCPTGQTAEVIALEKFEVKLASAMAGECVGVTTSKDQVLGRGLTLCAPHSPAATSDRITAKVFWVTEQPLKLREDIMLRLATQEIHCRVERIHYRLDSGSLQVLQEDAAELANSEVAEVTFIARSPMCYDSFETVPEMGRFVLVRDARSVGGGICLGDDQCDKRVSLT